jgi:iron complex outermembrane receptor protein
MQQDYNVYEDCDGTPSIICNYDGFYESEHFTQEFRLNGETGGLNWTAGLYYLNHDSSGGLAAPLYFTADGNPDPSGVTPGLGFYADFDNHLMAYAAFGQVEFAVTDTVTLIGGLRYSVDDRDFEQTYPVYTIETDNSRFPFDDPSDFLLSSHTVTGLLLEKNFTRATVGDLTNSNRDSVAWTAQVNWTPRDEQLFYASVRRGVKAAGFNNGSIPVFDITLDQYPFDQEVLTAYEIGEKISFADNRARINSAIFYYDYQDYQVIAFKTLGQVQTNADATITGAELELEVSPITGLDLSASVSLLHTEIKGISRGLGLPFVDREMGEAPEVALTALARYEWPAFGGQMSAQLSGNYTGERWTDAQNLTVGRLPAYTVFDAQVEFVTPDANTSILLWARNITDERVPFNTLVTLTGFGIGQQKWNERPVAGLTLRHHF